MPSDRAAARPSPSIPRWLEAGAAVGWRLIAVGVAAYLTWQAVKYLDMVLLPLFFGTIAAALLEPPARLLRKKMPRALAALIVVFVAISLVVGLVALMAWSAAGQLDEVGQGLRSSWESFLQFLRRSPLATSRADLGQYAEQAVSQAGTVLRPVAVGAMTLVSALSGGLLSIVYAFLFLVSGHRLFDWVVRIFPPDEQAPIRQVGERVWSTVGGYMRGIAFNATFNALATGLALAIIGVPLIGPLMLLTFIGSFIPFVGPIVAGVAASAIALASTGVKDALFVALAALIIQQFEGNVLEPLVLGKAVRMPPALVLLAVTAGLVLGGLAGAFVAVPLAAVIVSFLDARAKAHSDRARRQGDVPLKRT
jgi:putative heme transporter